MWKECNNDISGPGIKKFNIKWGKPVTGSFYCTNTLGKPCHSGSSLSCFAFYL